MSFTSACLIPYGCAAPLHPTADLIPQLSKASTAVASMTLQMPSRQNAKMGFSDVVTVQTLTLFFCVMNCTC